MSGPPAQTQRSLLISITELSGPEFIICLVPSFSCDIAESDIKQQTNVMSLSHHAFVSTDPDDVHSPSAAAKQTKLENKRRKKIEQKKSKSMNSSEYHCVNLKTTESTKLNSVHTFISRKVSAHVPVEWRTAKSAKKNKNSLKSRTLRKSEGSYTTFSDTGKPFKMGKKKRKKADNWRNKQSKL